MMSEFKNHPHDIFEQWYLASMGKSGNQSLKSKLTSKFNYFLNNIFTRVVPSLDRMHNNAFVLATANKNAVPSSRVVLLKDYSKDGYVFYTNYTSKKSSDLLENPVAAMNFFWSYPTRQVRIVGRVEKIPYEVSNKYWQSRPRGSQEGAVASKQSKKINSYSELTEQLLKVQNEYSGKDIPCPTHWGGFIIKPTSYEFWQAMPNRLHKRVRYFEQKQKWCSEFLSP